MCFWNENREHEKSECVILSFLKNIYQNFILMGTIPRSLHQLDNTAQIPRHILPNQALLVPLFYGFLQALPLHRPPSLTLRSNLEPNGAWSADDPRGNKRCRTFTGASLSVFPYFEFFICWNREHLNRQNGKYSCKFILGCVSFHLLNYFIVFFADGGKEFEDASAYQLPNAVHIARWPQFYRNFFSF